MSSEFTSGKKKVRLLVVEDNDRGHYEQIRNFADIMEDEIEIACELAETGKQALEMIRDWEPSVIMLDVYMPDITGLDILERCAEGKAPIVMTSQNQSEEVRDAALERGASAFLPKIDNPDEMESLFYLLADLSEFEEMKH